MANYLLFAHL